jgi:pimeloyl-ACP methyl ester esterase
MPYITTDKKITWHYEVLGEGDVLVFLHGWAASSRVFVQQAEYFSQKNKVILVDLPGHGKTSWQEISFDAVADEINVLLQKINVASFSLVGSSMGGVVALKLCARFPEKIKRLVMVGSLPQFCRSPGMPLGLDRAQFEKLKSQLAHKYPSILDIFFRSLFTIEERESQKFQWLHQFRREEDVPSKDALVYFLDKLGTEDLMPILKEIKIPALFIAGAQDYICPSDSLAFLKNILPRIHFHVIEQSGHFPFLIRSTEFNQAVEKFLLEK